MEPELKVAFMTKIKMFTGTRARKEHKSTNAKEPFCSFCQSKKNRNFESNKKKNNKKKTRYTTLKDYANQAWSLRPVLFVCVYVSMRAFDVHARTNPHEN